MHEASIARTLLSEVDRLVALHGAVRATEVRVQVGEFSGIDADLLESAFSDHCQAARRSPPKLVVVRTRLEAGCAACGERFHVQRFEFRCPSCRAEEVRVAGGEELLLESVQMEAI